MRRPTGIVLVLMGGGLALGGCDNNTPACRDARARHLPNTDELCRNSGSGTGHGGGFFSGHGTSSASAGSASVSRGGFGAAGAHASAGE